MSQFEKFLNKLLGYPTPNNISYSEMARFLLSIGCIMAKKSGGSHRTFRYKGYHEVITLMEDQRVREYQVKDIIRLLKFIGVINEEENRE